MKKTAAKAVASSGEFDESKHPRDKEGKWTFAKNVGKQIARVGGVLGLTAAGVALSEVLYAKEIDAHAEHLNGLRHAHAARQAKNADYYKEGVKRFNHMPEPEPKMQPTHHAPYSGTTVGSPEHLASIQAQIGGSKKTNKKTVTTKTLKRGI